MTDARGFYVFEYQVHTPRYFDPAAPGCELLDVDSYLTHIDGSILFRATGAARRRSAKAEAAEEVGQVEAQIVRLRAWADERPRSDLFSLQELFDRSDVRDFHAALFAGEEPSPAAQQLLGEGGLRRDLAVTDYLCIDRIEVRREHRGRGLGLAACLDLIRSFAGPDDVVACIPAPCDLPARATISPEAWHAAQRKLGRYWSLIGFRRVGQSEVWALSLHRRLPTVREALTTLRRRQATRERHD